MPLIQPSDGCKGSGQVRRPTPGHVLKGSGRSGQPHLLVNPAGETVLAGVVQGVSLRRASDKHPIYRVEEVDPDIEVVLISGYIGGTRIEDLKWIKATIDLVPKPSALPIRLPAGQATTAAASGLGAQAVRPGDTRHRQHCVDPGLHHGA